MFLAVVLLVVVGSFGGFAWLLLVPPRTVSDPGLQEDRPRFIDTLPPVPPPGPRGTEPAAARPIVVPLPPPPRPIRRCGHCRKIGHTKALCPTLTGALTLPQL